MAGLSWHRDLHTASFAHGCDGVLAIAVSQSPDAEGEEKRQPGPGGGGGGRGGGCLDLYLADAPTKQDPALTHASWIQTATKLGGPLEIKRSPLPKCTGEETEAPETKLPPLFSRGNDSGESALPQTQARQPGSQASLVCPSSVEWLASQLSPSLSRRHLSQASPHTDLLGLRREPPAGSQPSVAQGLMLVLSIPQGSGQG